MSILNSIDNNAPIAFFDSGVGGLTVLNKVKKILPNENFIYFGDTLHVPYGEKTKEQLLEYSDDIIKFFESKGCKAVVMACNTTSSVIYDDICGKYNVKLYPIVQSVAKILAHYPIERLGVFATKATISSNVYPREIAKYNPNMQVFGHHCPKWVSIVENNSLKDIESIADIKADLDEMMKFNPQKIVLGCTHYPFVDPAIDFANYIKSDLENNNLLNDGKEGHYEEFYVSSNPNKFRESSKMFYNLKQAPKLLTF